MQESVWHLPRQRHPGGSQVEVGREIKREFMNYREAEAVTVSYFAERMENIRRLSTYDSDALSTGLYSPRSKGILSEYSDCPSQTMV